VEIEEALRLETPATLLERLFRETGPVLWRSVYAFTGGRRDITEEAVSEAFARAMANIETIRDPVPWIFRTAYRLAVKEMRRERRQPPAIQKEVEAERPELHELMAALRRLSPKQRAAVVLHYQSDLPVAEVARLLGMSPATVKVHLFRGRKRLRELLGTEEVDDA
jgi:RNA polymerase sigma-70 factor, ECF subfamily